MSWRRRAWLAAGAGLFDRAVAGTPGTLGFPRDHGAHPQRRIEWWYITGWLGPYGAAPAQGFQLTFFRRRTAVPASHPSRFAASQLLFAHAALTDLQAPPARAFQHDQRIARAGLGLADAALQDTSVHLHGWSLRRQAGADGAHYRVRVDRSRAGFALDLDCRVTQPVLLHGEAGWLRKGPRPDEGNFYYTQPQLAVSGLLGQAGRQRRVQGRAWLDHEQIDHPMDPACPGWDWLGMNLDAGGALMVYRLRRHDGSRYWAGGSHRPAADAPVQRFAADEVRMQPLRHWTSPVTGARYPVAWQVDTPAGRWSVQALRDDQELDSRASSGAVYWEGLSALHDARGQRCGWGYLEMTGYPAPLRW